MAVACALIITHGGGFVKKNIFSIKQKIRKLLLSDFGGSGWIRTTEVSDNRFTVCPLWPLGNAPVLELVIGVEPTTC